MKISKRMFTTAIGMAAICLIFIASQAAWAGDAPEGVDVGSGNCTVSNSGWDHTQGSKGITLRTALFYANKMGPHYECYNKIELESDVYAKSPVVIKSPASGLVIKGNGHYINLEHWEEGQTATDGNSGHGCAIYVDAADVKIHDLNITSAEKVGLNGVCFMKTGGKFKTTSSGPDRVTVDVFKGGDVERAAFKIEGSSAVVKNVIVENSDIGLIVDGLESTIQHVTVAKAQKGLLLKSSENVIEDVKIDSVDMGVKVEGNLNRLVDVSINNSETDGIFLDGNKNKLARVRVVDAETAVTFGTGVTGNKILPSCEFQASAYGIVDDSSSSNSTTNIIVMTNRVPELDNDGYDAITDEGILKWLADSMFTEEDLLDGTGPSGNASVAEKNLAVSATGLLKSKKTVVPLVTSLDQIGTTGQYRVQGFFASVPNLEDVEDADGLIGGFEKLDCSALQTDTSVPRLAMFMVQDTDMTFVGAIGNTESKGVDNDDGTFDFYIDPGEEGQEDFSGSKFVMVPVNADWELMGRASNYKMLSNGQSDCKSGTGPDDGGGSSGNWSGAGRILEYFSMLQCSMETDFESGTIPTDVDSDLDGIPDFFEMAVRLQVVGSEQKWVYDPEGANCDCNAGQVLTCWYDPDTDDDGIKDGSDGYKIYSDYEFYSDQDYLDDDYLNEHGEPIDGTEKLVISPQPLNTDEDYPGMGKDALPDCKDPDSDGDSMKDGEEDRSRVYNKNAKAYYMYLETSLGKFYPADSYPEDPDDSAAWVECTQELAMDPEGKDTGIKYSIYIAGGTGSNYISKPIEATPFTDFSQMKEGQGLYPLACINYSVAKEHNFDGVYGTDQGETNYQSPDSENDCVCDGHGPGCAEVDSMPSDWPGNPDCIEKHGGTPTMDNPLWLDDQCPEGMHETNDCTPECVQGEIMLFALDHAPAGYVEEVDGIVQMVDADTDTVPDLFQQTTELCDEDTGECVTVIDYQLIYDSCSDIDNDGIPDCMERWSYECNPTQEQTTNLNPYMLDTDGDALADGMAYGDVEEDVCPFTPATGSLDDSFNEVNPHYSCTPTELYNNSKVKKVLSCFFDRDGDGVRDCIEDKDQDGYVDAPISGLAGIIQSESDPLKVDTDGDGLDDHTEFDGWPYLTNPALADTDGDDMDDKAEDQDGNGFIEKTDQTGLSCANVGLKDTDPRYADTDGDGLKDNVELMYPIIDPDIFQGLLEDATVWAEGISHGSDPNAADSDNDGLMDSEEFDGETILFHNSNPCMKDSDGDSIQDADELPGCRLNADPNCVGSEDGISGGYDADSDGLTDLVEAMLGTDPNDFDTDDDGVKDGDEDVNHNGVYEPSMGETNPLAADTDADGLNDGFELRYGTDPTTVDSDADCIPDGVEDANHNGQFDMGAETNAVNSDTDGDGLPDGWVAMVGMGEDLNCNGIRDTDAEGRYLETDPRNPDSDLDGFTDYEEMVFGGRGFQTNNINRATTGSEGCSMVGTAGGSPTSMFYLMGMLLAAVKAIAIKRKKYSA